METVVVSPDWQLGRGNMGKNSRNRHKGKGAAGMGTPGRATALTSDPERFPGRTCRGCPDAGFRTVVRGGLALLGGGLGVPGSDQSRHGPLHGKNGRGRPPRITRRSPKGNGRHSYPPRSGSPGRAR